MAPSSVYRLRLIDDDVVPDFTSQASLSSVLASDHADIPILDRTVFRVLDVIRPSDARRAEQALEALPHVASAKVQKDCSRIVVDVLGAVDASDSIRDVLDARGIRVLPEAGPVSVEAGRKDVGIVAVLALASLGLAAGWMHAYGAMFSEQVRDVALDVQALLAGAMVFWAGAGPIQRAFARLFRGVVGADTVPLMIGVFIVAHGWWTFFAGGSPEFSAGIVVLAGTIVLSKRLNGERVRIGQLVDTWRRCQDGRITVVMDEGAFQVGSRRLHVDDILIVRAGELVPVDGIALQGSGFVRQLSPSTGSEPRQILEGESVWAGMEVVTGAVALRAKTASSESRLARAADGVERLAGSTDWTEGRVQRIVLSYVGLIALVCIAWINVSGIGLEIEAFSFERFVSLMLVSLPFALTYGASSRSFEALEELAVGGAFIPSLGTVETLGRRENLVLDIDGVLTCGTPEVDGWIIQEGASADEAWHVITALASHEPTQNLKELRAFGQETIQDANAGPSFGEVVRHGTTGRKGRDDAGRDWALLEGQDVLKDGGTLRNAGWGNVGFGTVGEPDSYGGVSEQQVWYLLKNRVVIARIHLVDPLRVEAKEFCATLTGLGLNPKVADDGASSRAEHYAQSLAVGLAKIDDLKASHRSESIVRVRNEETTSELGPLGAPCLVMRYGRGLATKRVHPSELLVLSESMVGIAKCLQIGVAYRKAGRARIWTAGVLSVLLGTFAIVGVLSWFVASTLGVAANGLLSRRLGAK